MWRLEAEYVNIDIKPFGYSFYTWAEAMKYLNYMILFNKQATRKYEMKYKLYKEKK